MMQWVESLGLHSQAFVYGAGSEAASLLVLRRSYGLTAGLASGVMAKSNKSGFPPKMDVELFTSMAAGVAGSLAANVFMSRN